MTQAARDLIYNALACDRFVSLRLPRWLRVELKTDGSIEWRADMIARLIESYDRVHDTMLRKQINRALVQVLMQ